MNLIPASNFKVVKLTGKYFYSSANQHIILDGYGMLDIAKNEYVSMSHGVMEGNYFTTNSGKCDRAIPIPTTYKSKKTASCAIQDGLHEGYATVKVGK
jgi:hypothetical protein